MFYRLHRLHQHRELPFYSGPRAELFSYLRALTICVPTPPWGVVHASHILGQVRIKIVIKNNFLGPGHGQVGGPAKAKRSGATVEAMRRLVGDSVIELCSRELQNVKLSSSFPPESSRM